MSAINYYNEFEKLVIEIAEPFKVEAITRIKNARPNYKQIAIGEENARLNKQTGELNVRMGGLNTFYNEVHKAFGLNKTKKNPELFNERFEQIESDKREHSLKLLAEQRALELVSHAIYKETRKLEKRNWPKPIKNDIITYQSPLIWKGTETEYMQLIRALHRAGYLDNQEHEISKLAKQFTSLISFELGNSPESNLSKNIHNTKNPPKIFDKLKKAFENYTRDLRDEKEGNLKKSSPTSSKLD